MWWCIPLAGLLSGCGLVAFLVNEPVVSEHSLRLEQGVLPVEVRLRGHPPVWEWTDGRGIRVGAGTVIALRVEGLTMFAATLRLRSSAGYRLLLRTTPHEWKQRPEAALELTGEADRVLVRAGTRYDTFELPTSGSHLWRFTQWEGGIEARFECLPPLWFASDRPLTEWILLQPLPGSVVTLEGLSWEEAVPFLLQESQGQ